jgi:cyclohexadienyl dehydratase
VRQWADIDQPGVQVAVQAGTFMEPVMEASLKRAQLVRIRPPATREQELEAGRVDVFMTDYPYSRRLLDNADWAALISPPQRFHVLPYAYAVKPGDDDWLAVVDGFVQRIQRDGRLATAAAATGWATSWCADAARRWRSSDSHRHPVNPTARPLTGHVAGQA